MTLALVVLACAPDHVPGSEEAELVAPQCSDEAPDDRYTCGQQLAWGKCGEPWMAGKCDRTCGRCAGIGNTTDVCEDIPPGGGYSCAQQAAWGKCNEPWMEGHCQVSCGRCLASAQLIDPAATPAARKLMSYLVDLHGDAVLAGQHGLLETEHMAQITGRLPAIFGVDFMDYSPSRVAHGAKCTETDHAIDWHEHGGIVTVMWHWNAPSNLKDSYTQPWWKGFYSAATTFDLERAMFDLDSQERQLLVHDIDAIAQQLQRLEDAGAPVLWRPIHEASGGWFWWGAHGPGPYIALWRLLYDRLVNHHGLHNLIWVWNGQDAAYYPGDQYVDIVGEDIYEGRHDYQPHEAAYLEATRYGGMPKLPALTETGTLPDPARMMPSRARWSWFMLWSGEYAIGETWNSNAMKRAVYDSELVITLDELP